MTRIGSLCTGYGGLDHAAQTVLGGDLAWVCDPDPGAATLLAHRYPHIPNHHDLTVIDWTTAEAVDVLTAGWPCQPFSLAGRRKGAADERAIWPHIARAVRDLRPRHVVLENVAAVVASGELARALGDLAALGYDAAWRCLRAADVGAPHRRERLFIIAAPDPGGGQLQRRRIGGELAGPPGPGAGEGAQRERDRDPPRDGGPAATDPGGEARALGTGLRAARAGDIRRGRPDDHGVADAAPDPDRAGRRAGRGMGGGAGTAALGDRRGEAAPDPDGRGLPELEELDAEQRGRDETSAHGDDALRRRLGGTDVDWAAYTGAIRRWEHILGRPAPAPTVLGRRGGHQLAPRFVEWLMGLPDGWVTDVPGLSRNQMLKLLGNGVVPQQAAAALTHLLGLLLADRAAV